MGGDPLAQVRDDPSPCLLALVVRELRDSLRGEAELGGLVAQLMSFPKSCAINGHVCLYWLACVGR